MSRKQLRTVYSKAPRIPIDQTTKLVFMSDCHRGNGSLHDIYVYSEEVCLHAMEHYLVNGYTYVEVGDGDELWENTELYDLIRAHPKSYAMLKSFFDRERLVMIFGNHDYCKHDEALLEHLDHEHIEEEYDIFIEMYKDMPIHEGVVFEYKPLDLTLFAVHGHQLDVFNNRLMPLSRFLVHNFWAPLELKGFVDPRGTTLDNVRHKRAGKNLARWSADEKQIIICGHTHRPAFSDRKDIPYFNDGCCVFPNIVTCIEISNGKISLVKWEKTINEKEEWVIDREYIEGPIPIRYLNDTNPSEI